MGFRVKIAPGVRVGLSSRGVRTSVGPRAARVHVGGGRPGVSTGIGPFTAYTSLGGGRRRSGGSSGGVSDYERRLAAAQRRQEREDQKAERERLLVELSEEFEALLTVHRHDEPTAHPPQAPTPPAIDEHQILHRHLETELAGISVFHHAERKAAKERARMAAGAEIERTRAENDDRTAAAQKEIDVAWAALLANDPTAVLAAIEHAFEDNDVAAAPIDCEDGRVSILMICPSIDAVPERLPGRGSSGRPTFKKLTKTERNEFHRELVFGHALATVREAMAVAPRIREVAIVICRLDPYDDLEALACNAFRRGRLADVDWYDNSASEIFVRAGSHCLVNLGGRTDELRPLDLSDEPELAELMASAGRHLSGSDDDRDDDDEQDGVNDEPDWSTPETLGGDDSQTVDPWRDDARIRVLTWNVAGGPSDEKLDWLVQQTWDIAILQEVSATGLDRLTRSEGIVAHASSEYLPRPTHRGRRMLAAVCAREPIVLGWPFSLPGFGVGEDFAEQCVAVTAQWRGTEITVVSLHAPNAAVRGQGAKEAVYAHVSEWLRDGERGPVVLGIDTNTWTRGVAPIGEAVQADLVEQTAFLRQDASHPLIDVYRRAAANDPALADERVCWTYDTGGGPNRGGRVRMDQIYASPSLSVLGAGILHDARDREHGMSDHAAVWAELGAPQAGTAF